MGKGSYADDAGRVRTFLEPGELVELLPGFSVEHYWEGLGPEHRHGEGAPERHGKVEAVFRKESAE